MPSIHHTSLTKARLIASRLTSAPTNSKNQRTVRTLGSPSPPVLVSVSARRVPRVPLLDPCRTPSREFDHQSSFFLRFSHWCSCRSHARTRAGTWVNLLLNRRYGARELIAPPDDPTYAGISSGSSKRGKTVERSKPRKSADKKPVTSEIRSPSNVITSITVERKHPRSTSKM